HALSVFPEIVLAKELDEGMRVLVQAHSIGPLKSNTVVFGWPRTVERAVPFFRHLQDCSRLGKSVVAVVDRGLPERHKALRRIDIWWRGQANGSLMVILAHLLTQNMDWRHARMRILRIIRDDTGREEAHQALEQLVHGARVDADVAIIVSTKGIGDTLGEHSGDADVVFLGLELADEGTAPEAYQRYESAVSALPTTLLVHSSGDADVLQ
ncbi:MAG: hypothetical protein RBU37_17185, partial [Myxococcota bacterium]|nr:hypothetical protein [Myxococcota bacterium]